MPVEPAPRKVRTPDEPALRRKDELIIFWAERIAQKIPYEGTASRHTSPRYEKNSILMNGDSIYSYGHHFELARIIRRPSGVARIVLCNGDRWDGGSRWGSGTWGDQMRVRDLVKSAIDGTNIEMMTVPFSALEAAGIELSSVVPVEVRPDRYETTHHTSDERPGPLQQIPDPSGATYPHSQQDWGYVHNETGEVFRHGWNDEGTVYVHRPEPLDEYTWSEYTHVEERPVMVDDPNRAYHDSYGRGDRQTWHGDAELQSDGTWAWTIEHHRLGDSLLRARYTERRTRPATKAECAQHDEWLKAERERRVAQDAWHEAQNAYSNLTFVRRRYDEGRDIPFDFPAYPSDEDVAAAERNRDEVAERYHRIDATVREMDAGPVDKHRDLYTVRYTVRKTAYFLSSFDYGEPHRPYFMCELPSTVKRDGVTHRPKPTTIDEALDWLRPDEIVQAQRAGVEVLRQGDVFAIPTSLTTKELQSHAITFTAQRIVEQSSYDTANGRWVEERREDYQESIRKLRGQGDATVLGTNHSATHVILTDDGETYARGRLYHTPSGWNRRPEHRVVKLGDGQTWYRLVKNTVPMGQTNNVRVGLLNQSGQSRAWMLGGAVD